MPTSVLITGISGFVGRHLERECIARGMKVSGTVLTQSESLDSDGTKRSDRFILELTDRRAMRSILETVKPDVVIHLAAIAFVPDAGDPTVMDAINHQGTNHLAEAMIEVAPQSHLLFVSSAEVFGRATIESLPFTERSPEQPINSYGESKLAAEQAIRHLGSHLPWTIVRPFNHIGPGQNDRFAIPAWCKQLVSIQAGTREPILRVGNLDVSKDFTDVRDVVRAYADLIEHRARVARGQLYVIGSGRAISLRDVLDHVISIAGLSDRITIEIDPERYRPEPHPITFGSAEKIQTHVGWRPRIPLIQTLHDCLQEMRERTDSSSGRHAS